MKNDGVHRLPPPPLFTIRPPPKPPGSLFQNFQTVEILNGRCVRPSLNILNSSSSSSTILQKHEQSVNWLHLFLLVLAIISVICCIIIGIFIFICLKKLRKEEKQYQSYIMSGSFSSSKNHHYRRRHDQHIDTCSRTNEHYKCVSNTFNCCDDYYSHQVMPMTNVASHSMAKSNEISQPFPTDKVVDGQDTPQNHQYECIPEYLLTMNRHHHPPLICHHAHPLYQQANTTCGVPYNTFSRSYLIPQGATAMSTSNSSQCTCSPPSVPLPSVTIAQEESSTPLLTSAVSNESRKIEETSSSSPRKSFMIGWTRRKSSSSSRKQNSPEQRTNFLSHLRKSSLL